jgi:hypothetical protein
LGPQYDRTKMVCRGATRKVSRLTSKPSTPICAVTNLK